MGVCVCASVTDFTDFTSTTVLLYVVLCYVPSWEIRISRIYFSVKYKRI